ncbi:hypothetical protein VTJ83DRAFT_2104 [Remersonia thermophila]|uniref:MFS transporter n=1 Tax=Remersonia thermophila TaxID=72144 RepID=A0ABR4DHV9_9PEZI
MAPKDVAGVESASPRPIDVGEKPTVLENEEKAVVSNGGNVESDPREPEFKEGGYGWVVVLAVFLVNAHTWGFNSSYGVFLAYYLRTGSMGGSSALGFAFVGGLSISIAMLTSPFATWCIGRFGTVPSLRVGVVFVSASFIGASFASHIWQLILSQGICFGIGMGFCFTTTGPVVAQYFVKRRSFANAIGTAGSGIGGLVYSLATNAMISNLGLEWAFRILAIISFVVNGACSLIMRDRNKAIGTVHSAFHKELIRWQECWLFMAWGIFSIIAYIVVVFSITDYAQTVGFTASQGSLAAAMYNLSNGVGRPIIGLASDHFGKFNVAGIGTLIAGLTTFFLWTFAGVHFAGLIVYAVLGAFGGIIWPCLAPLGAEVVGLQLLPSVFSIYWIVLVLPSTFAEVIGLSLRTSGIHGYLNVQVFTGAMYIAAFISIWLLRSWKLKQLELLGSDSEQQSEGGQVTGPSGGVHKRCNPGPRDYLYGMIAVKNV